MKIFSTAGFKKMNKIDSHKFAGLLREKFPAIQDEVTEWDGLGHLQMMEFAIYTQKAIDAADWATVNKCLLFADELLRNGDDELKNAVHVSYLETLPREGEDRNRLWGTMTPQLQAAWTAILKYLKQLD